MMGARKTGMNVGLIVPGFSADESDWCIPALRDLVRAIGREDDVRVCALRYPYRAGRYELFGGQVTALGGGVRQGAGSALLWARSLAALASEHRRRPFVVLHAFWGGETGAVAALAGALLRVPVVLSLAGGELVGFRDIRYGGQLARAERVKTGLAMRLAAQVTVGSTYMMELAVSGRVRAEAVAGSGDISPASPGAGPSPPVPPPPDAKAIGLKERSPLKGPEGWYARCTRGRDALAPSMGRGTAHGRLPVRAPLGVDMALFRPGQGDAGASPPRLVQVASLVPVKDQATLLSAAAILRDRGLAFRLEIAGVGPLEAELRALAARLDLRDRVAFRGAIPHDRLRAFYAGAVAYVQSSLHESQGMALLEAAACGVPAVGTRVGVLPELEQSCAAGCGVGDPEGLADAATTLLDDRDRAATMGTAARAVVESEYGLGRCVERFRAIYAGLG